jgi:YidC/Oxa1 family membrane protein insertase
MQPRNRFTILYIVVGVGLLIGWTFLQDYIWPKPEKPKPARTADVVGFYAGGLASGAMSDLDVLEKVKQEREEQKPAVLGLGSGGAVVTAAYQADALTLTEQERAAAALRQGEPDTLIPLGWGDKPFHLRVLLNDHGGAIQQVVTSDFQQADREGLAVVNPDGTPRPLHLIPGVVVPRTPKMRDQRDVSVPELKPGPVDPMFKELAHPSYVMTHYAKENDPWPVDTLATRHWRVVPNVPADPDTQVVAFETELGAPFYIRITKTYTLSRTDYHVGLAVTLTPTERPAGVKPEPFRYQIDGPRNMPIEGEWYTTTYRNGIVGWRGSRALEDARTARHTGGSDRYPGKEGRPIKYAGVMLQYFASVLAVDNVQPPGQEPDYVEFVRFTPEGPTHEDKARKIDQTFLDDLTFRAISKKLDVSAPVTHPYVLYHGPVKVRLLKELGGEQAVPDETVDRYKDDLELSTLTDAPSQYWIGRFASFIGWSDLVIFFTNVVHWLLGLLSHVITNTGLCILIITMMVRALLHPVTRRQAINGKIMQAKMARLNPELKKIQEKYGDDPMRVHSEKNKLMRAHGINPAAMMGGCLPLLLQMPVFMGLYYALQESIFFRLEPATPWWIPNLAAPDMLARWGESIPWISAPESLGGTLYLGPYFNLLPLIAVALMMYTQSKMMPKSDDPQVQMQQTMMKVMMVFMLFFFYKSAAGLAIYFIASSIWGMIERRLLPKDIERLEKERDARKARKAAAAGGERGEPTGWLGKKMAGWREKWEQILEEAQKQQQAQREQRPQGPGQNGPPGPQGPGRKKKKKR